MIIIGLDPGQTTGIAEVQEGKLIDLNSMQPVEVIDELIPGLHPDKVLLCIEDTRNQPIHQSKRGKAGNSIHRIARSVGQIDALCDLYEAAALRAGLTVTYYEPTGQKWTREILKAVTGWDGPSNQHTRDAARAAMYAHSHLRIKEAAQ